MHFIVIKFINLQTTTGIHTYGKQTFYRYADPEIAAIFEL